VNNILISLSEVVQDGDEKQAVKLVKQALKIQIPAVDILNKGLVSGVQALSKLFKDGQAFLPEILISVRAMNMGLEVLLPHISAKDVSHRGMVVLGTVEGDIHDIGKNLVGMMLKSNGFEVVDLGVDVNAESYINAVRENNADIVAMSGLLTTTITYFPVVIQALKDTGLRDKVRVMVGGASASQTYADEIGADSFATDCISAVDEAVRLMTL
jgi:5-methyltetrahydrofolate--homocysteine methyltransferase